MATESSSFSGTSSGQESMNTGGSEGSVILITKHKLTGHNYHQWAKSVMMFISGKGKDDYLTGAASPPWKDDPSFRMWKTENNMVMSWLINTMDTEIGQNFLFYDTAYEIWMAAKETYSDNDNTAELFDIKGALHDLRQGEMSVTQYYNTLSRFWQQLDGFESLDWECPADASQYKKVNFGFWGNLVTWRSKKQSVVARSSAEAAFRAMAHGICEGMWLKKLLEELLFPPSASMKLMCDNKAVISIAKNPVHHDRTKHIEIDRHFIKEKIEQGVIEARAKLRHNSAAVQVPIGLEDDFQGLVDLVHLKAYYFLGSSGEKVVSEEIPSNIEALVAEKRRELIEVVSEVDDKLAEAFLSDEPISSTDLEEAIQRATISLRFIPVSWPVRSKTREDPTFHVGLDAESGPVDATVAKPRVNFRETVTQRAEFDYLYKKQSGGQDNTEGFVAAKPVILEPVMLVGLKAPTEFQGTGKGEFTMEYKEHSPVSSDVQMQLVNTIGFYITPQHGD
ncbi:hypothetical protein RJ640_020537 [Escallonia rubra]|uniref:Retrotransposon Copia-like N-terminal domain-containing protein n=1 Tax=Escallonia rubra TaxID=112253 RepID=A0AA88R988_9ASTE|nr:hypothetical protein RJ640_020537 [Escallonia rubra]